LVVDDNSKFQESNFNKAMESMGESVNVIGMESKNNKKKMNQGSDLFKIIKVIMEKQLDPVIIFSFSKKDVEAYAKSVCSKYDLTTKAEKERID
jgi:ATP-dependent RNA helicase DOB1